VLKDILCNGKRPSAKEMEHDLQTFFAAWISIMHPAGLANPFDHVSEDMIPQAGKDWAGVIYRLMELLEDEKQHDADVSG